MRMRTSVLCCLLGLASGLELVIGAGLSVAAAAPATPAPSPTPAMTPSPAPASPPGTVPGETGDVVVGGVIVLRIRAEAGGMSVQERLVQVRRRIVEALSRTRGTAPPVTVRRVAGQAAIFAGEVLIITVDANHARLNGMSQQALADLWAARLREGLAKAAPQPVPGLRSPAPSPSPSPSP